MSRIPFVGRLTPWEFLSGLALVFSALAGVGLLVEAYGLLTNPAGQGSGGGAMFVVFMYLGVPMILFGGGALVTCAICAWLLVRRIAARLRGTAAKPARYPNNLLRLTHALNWTALAFVALTTIQYIFPNQVSELMSDGMLDAIQLFVFGTYLVLIGALSSQLERSWQKWLLATLLTIPFGPVVAYFALRLEVESALGALRGV